MFLNSTPEKFEIDSIGLSQDQYERNLKLLDYDVNYYGFLESKEYKDFYTSLEGKTLTQDMYESPYFGTFVSSAYAGLDRLYETYKSQIDILDPNLIAAGRAAAAAKVSKTGNDGAGGINPMLILAAAAAFFFAG